MHLLREKSMKRVILIVLTLVLAAGLTAADKRVPTVEDLLAVKTLSGTEISPDGKWIAYTIREADLDEDAYITHIWIAETVTGETWQLTRGKKSCSNYEWSPCGKWLSFTSSRDGKNQIYVIRPNGGEALRLTDAGEGVGGYEWSPDGGRILFSMRDEEGKELKDRKDHMGAFDVVRREYRHTHLYVFDVKEAFQRRRRAGSQKARAEGARRAAAGFRDRASAELPVVQAPPGAS